MHIAPTEVSSTIGTSTLARRERKMGDWFEKITYGDLVNRAAARYGDKEYMYFEGHRWSFRQVQAAIDRAARGLIALGVRSGDHVSVWLGNRPEWVLCSLPWPKSVPC
jgi:non-ribosomal peptide synthetase component E (peptide arylation enzyme)